MKNVILHLPSCLTTPSPSSPSASQSHNPATASATTTLHPKKQKITILFFITGNPGLIGYYDEFLALLAHAQTAKTKQSRGKCMVIAGASLGGFFTMPQEDMSEQGQSVEQRLTQQLLLPDAFQTKDIYDLQDQIHLSYMRLLTLVQNLRKEFQEGIGGDDAITEFEVILAGHSVGAYIALELVRLHHEASVEEFGVESTKKNNGMFEILATILLTPTIHNISQSPSGRIATPILNYLPFFPAVVQLGASGLAATLPKSWMQSIVRRVTGMKSSNAIDTTTDFLCLPGAVKQALYMAGCEMKEIGEDKWTEEVWGAVDDADATVNGTKAHNQWTIPKHFFLFAKEDHWVANATREAIASKMCDRAVFMIDNEGQLGIQHAWCLQQSGIIAGIVNSWIDELFDKVR